MLLVSRENSTSNPSAIAMLCTMHHVKNNCEIRRTCSMRNSDQGKGTDASYDAPYWLKLHITSMKTAYKIDLYCNICFSHPSSHVCSCTPSAASFEHPHTQHFAHYELKLFVVDPNFETSPRCSLFQRSSCSWLVERDPSNRAMNSVIGNRSFRPRLYIYSREKQSNAALQRVQQIVAYGWWLQGDPLVPGTVIVTSWSLGFGARGSFRPRGPLGRPRRAGGPLWTVALGRMFTLDVYVGEVRGKTFRWLMTPSTYVHLITSVAFIRCSSTDL